MAYEYTSDQLSYYLDDSGVFNTDDRDEIIQALQHAGLFSPSSPGGENTHVEFLNPGDAPADDTETAIYQGAPQNPVTLDPDVDAHIFATDDAVEATLHGTGE